MKVGKHLVKGTRDIADQVSTHRNKGMLSKTCRSLLSTLPMTVGKADGNVSENVVGGQILGLYSTGARHRTIKKARIKRKRFDEQDMGQFFLVDKEKKHWKYHNDEIEGLRNYMVNNTYTR